MGCAYGGCSTVALPATRETANQSKGLLFSKAPDMIFSQVLSLKEGSNRVLTFITGNLSLLGCGFRGELGSPTGSPVLPQFLLLARCPLALATVPFQAC